MLLLNKRLRLLVVLWTPLGLDKKILAPSNYRNRSLADVDTVFLALALCSYRICNGCVTDVYRATVMHELLTVSCI